MMNHLGGQCHQDNPGPGDLFNSIQPLDLDDKNNT